MALIFPYALYRVRRPVLPLGGALARRYPVLPIILQTPTGGLIKDALLDPGADDTILPLSHAAALGIDLTQAAEGEAMAVGGGVLRYRYATVTMRVSDARETCVWDAMVGFVNKPLRWILLGRTGFL